MLSSSSRLNVLQSFDSPADTSQSRFSTAWWVFVALAATLLPLMVSASFDFGVTWDEKPRHHYGELVWEFMRGLRARNTTYVEDGGHLYGGLFDTICAAVEQYVPVNRYVLRHAINAAFGWIGIVYVGRLAARLFGQWAGVLGLLLIAVSPRYFADSMNNPKDLPFAAATAAALYYFSTMSPRWPYLSRSTAFKIVLALAAALNIRAAALLYLGYFGLLIGAFVLAERQFDRRRLLDTFLRVVAVTAGVLVLGTVFWPWAMASPFVRPIEALLSFANAPFGADVLFNGRPVPSNDLPWYYVPVWLLISTPPVVLVGLVLAGLFTKREWSPALFALSAMALLPIALVIVQHSTLYDGVRHLLFIYPVIVVLAAAGWTAALSRRDPLVRRITAVLLVIGLVNILTFTVRAHPNESAYFNELVGGPKGAFSRYDMDYWGNCVLQAVGWSAKTAQLSGVPVVISGEPSQIIQLDSERFHQLSFEPPFRNKHQLDVRLARGSGEGVAGLAGRPDALYRVQMPDGAVLCVVEPGPAFAQLQPHLKLPPAGLTPHQLIRP
jgi:Dolichyl-phosphate-mannose-protein mannosyltransferase